MAERAEVATIVALTTGDRPDDVARMVASAATQSAERILVANGVEIDPPAGWRVVPSAKNLGVPGGRAFGMACASHDVIVLLDDDSVIVTPDLVDRVAARFAEDPALGALALRVDALDEAKAPRRWRTAIGRGDGLRSAYTFPGNGHALRRSAVDEVGGYGTHLFFKHEETDLAWRLLDAGWQVAHDPQLVVAHPATAEARHPFALRMGVRNKLWIVRAQLPWVLVPFGVGVAFARNLVRCRSGESLRELARGLREGLGSLPVERSPMRWGTVFALVRRGRPPVL